MKFNHAIVCFMLVALLSACGDDVLTGSDIDPGSDLNLINTFVITGSDVAVDGVVPINSSINGGAFVLDWSVTSSNPYDYMIFASSTGAFAESGEFFNGSSSCVGSDCVSITNLSCNLTVATNTNFELACDTGVAVDITLAGINPVNYIGLRVCHRATQACVTKPVQVAISG